jgi:hypothetical protein
MNTLARDPKGYYAVLGLSPDADLETIKAAYRSRVKTVHPDRDASTPAREEFRRLMEAYAVLRDVIRRAEYDHAAPILDSDAASALIPVACGSCGVISAQPRYVAFRTVRSFGLWAKTGRLEGIFCRDCADHAAVRASILTWLWGWWSLPGLLLTPYALLVNLLGGHRPKRENTRILIRQARAFLGRGDLRLSRSLAEQALVFAREVEDRARIGVLLRATQVAAGGPRLKSRWRSLGGVFLAQALPLLALPVTALVFALIASRSWWDPVRDQPVSTTASIAVQPARIGEIRHVALEGLKLRMAPVDGAPVLTLLDRFTTVEVTSGTASPDWVAVRTPSGIDGFVETRALYAGSGSRFKTEWCADNTGAAPIPGEVLSRRVSGDHRLLIHNDRRRDAVVKLKSLTGSTVMTVFVPATFHIGVSGIPEGTYRIEFATGGNYSRGCGLFIDEMQSMVMPVTVTFKYLAPTANRSMSAIAEIWLDPPAGTAPPLPLSPDRFAADE